MEWQISDATVRAGSRFLGIVKVHCAVSASRRKKAERMFVCISGRGRGMLKIGRKEAALN